MLASIVVPCASALVLLSSPSGLMVGQGDSVLRAQYSKLEVSVPMRDGTRLFTAIYTPRDTTRTYPLLLYRTPYSVGSYGPDAYPGQLGPSALFDSAGYIFVLQDVRGKFRSEGLFKVMRLHRGRTGDQVDETTDTYDTIAWLLQHVPRHNGRVGQWGISYSGWQTVMGMIEAHPALVASSPQAPPADMFIGDDWHHNGAFRLMYTFHWLSGNARRRSGPTQDSVPPFDYGTPWGYQFFLEAGPLSRITDTYFRQDVPAWGEFMQHGTYDAYWKAQNVHQYLGGVRHAILNVAGWFDAEDFYGPLSIYREIERRNPGNRSTLAVGPWKHGGWQSSAGDHLGCITFGSETASDFHRNVLFPFFERHLKARSDSGDVEAVVFETGSNVWRHHAEWPPAAAKPHRFYLHGNGKLEVSRPTVRREAADSYFSDPARPVPFSAEIRNTQGHDWMIEDQRFVAGRPDVLVYTSEPLRSPLTIAGPIQAHLFVSTTGTDADWIVKVIDVLPGDAPSSTTCQVPMGHFQMLLSGEINRAKFRRSLEVPTALRSGELTEITLVLPDRYHTFKVGHRIMVQIQSSWFPVYDRNPQTFVDIYSALDSAFRASLHRVYRSSRAASFVEFGVLE